MPIDPWFIVEKASGQAQLISTARNVNDEQPAFVARLVQEMIAGIDSPRVVLLGEAYKENVDDVRESPARELSNLLEASDLEVVIIDPNSTSECPFREGAVTHIERGFDLGSGKEAVNVLKRLGS